MYIPFTYIYNKMKLNINYKYHILSEIFNNLKLGGNVLIFGVKRPDFWGEIFLGKRLYTLLFKVTGT